MFKRSLTAAVLLSAATPYLFADTISAPLGSATSYAPLASSLPGLYGSTYYPSTLGQTFIAPAGAPSLQDFTFYISTQAGILRDLITPFVAPWNGPAMYPNGTPGPGGTLQYSSGGAGTPIFTAPLVDFHTANVYGGVGVLSGVSPLDTAGSQDITANGQWQAITINTGGLNLTAGKAYVIGLTIADPNSSAPNTFYPGVADAYTYSIGTGPAVLAVVPNQVAGDGGGGLVTQNNPGNFDAIGTGTWWNNNINAPNSPTLARALGDGGDLAFTADFNPTFTVSGSLSPTSKDLEYKELIYSLNDGATTIQGVVALNGTCLAGTTCNFTDELSYYAPPGFTPDSITYSILGFYGSNGVYGPQQSDTTYFNGTYYVDQNPDVFALTNSGFQAGGDWSTFWPPYGENYIATILYNGGLNTIAQVSGDAWSNFVTSALGGTLATGNIVDFSNGVLNGSFSLNSSSSQDAATPEPGTLAGAGLLIVGLGLRRWLHR